MVKVSPGGISMAAVVHVETSDGMLQVHASGLVHFDEGEARLSVPYGSIEAVRVGRYQPPEGTWHRGPGEEVPLAQITAGHLPMGRAWCFIAVNDPSRVLLLDLNDFEWALRPYARLVLEVADPEALCATIEEHVARARQEDDAPGETPIAWMAISPGMPVVDRDGRRCGVVTHALGDLEEDVFEGIALRIGVGAGVHMAAPDAIDRLTDQAVYLRLTTGEARSLPPVALQDLREVTPGGGIFRHRPGWRRSSHWDEGTPR